jgi:ABC-2 type transport system permease protein
MTAAATPASRPAWPLVSAVVRLEQKSFWRNKQSAVFSFAMPLLFVLILPNVIDGNAGRGVSFKSYFVAGMIAISLVSSTYTTLAISVSFQRDLLTLKRLRGTPLTPLMLFFGKVASSAITVVIQVAIILGIGRLAYGIPLPRNWLTLIVFILLGIVSFSLIGLAYTAFIPNGDSAPALVQLPYLVLQFISGVFFPFQAMPTWLQHFASLFPLRWLADGLRAGYLGTDYLNGRSVGGVYIPKPVSGVDALVSQWPGLLMLTLWGALALVVGLRMFKWEKRAG